MDKQAEMLIEKEIQTEENVRETGEEKQIQTDRNAY